MYRVSSDLLCNRQRKEIKENMRQIYKRIVFTFVFTVAIGVNCDASIKSVSIN